MSQWCATPVERESTQRPNEETRTDVFRPNVDIYETPEELVVHADIPGAKSEDVEVKFEKGVLTLAAKVAPRHADIKTYLAREYPVGDYHRTFQVHESIDANRIAASYANGVLTLRLPKAEAARPRKIAVQSS